MKRIYSATAVPGHNSDPHSANEYTQDEAEIARFGKRQQLRVRLFIRMTFLPSIAYAAYSYIYSEILVWYL